MLNIEVSVLDRWRGNLEQIKDISLEALGFARQVDKRVSDLLLSLNDIALATCLQLIQAGATPPIGGTMVPEETIDFTLLISDKNRELLKVLEDSVRLSYAINTERGQNSSPTSQLLEYLREQTALECNGPRNVPD